VFADQLSREPRSHFLEVTMPTVAALTRDGALLTLDRHHVEGLRAALRGPLLLAGDPGYDEARSVWNGMIDRRPALVARCLGTADVMAGIRFARETGIVLSMKGGGHNISGLAVAEGGLVLDLSSMRGVWVDTRARTARAQAGCLLGDVDRETQLHGLAAVLGFVSATGIAGLTLGGGFGYASRRFGWTTDNVRSMEVVTPDGRLVRASEEEHADLFWGLRGGGGNFGVLTGVEYVLHPLGPEVYAGAIAWRAEEAPRVLEMFRHRATEAPPDLALVAGMRLAPPAPWLVPEVHGQPIVMLLACHTGDVAEAERQLAPIKAFGKPVGDILQRRPYVTQQSLLDATQPRGRRYYWKSEYLPRIEGNMLAKVMEHAARIISPHSAIIVFPLGGAVGKLPNDHSAVGNRDAVAALNIAASWDKADEDAVHVEWARSTWRDMRRFSTGGTYVNFLTEEETTDRIAAAYGDNLPRLAEIKARWDPTNLFRTNKNVAPAPAR
jgi:FAD/FMN-containing dehydrogenase